MDKDILWELFRDTGDITAFLLYRRAKSGEKDGA